MVFLFSFKWKGITFHAFYNIYSQSTGPRSPLFAKSHIKTKWTIVKQTQICYGRIHYCFFLIFYVYLFSNKIVLLFLKQKHHKVKGVNLQILSSFLLAICMYTSCLYWNYFCDSMFFVNGSGYLERCFRQIWSFLLCSVVLGSPEVLFALLSVKLSTFIA